MNVENLYLRSTAPQSAAATDNRQRRGDSPNPLSKGVGIANAIPGGYHVPLLDIPAIQMGGK